MPTGKTELEKNKTRHVGDTFQLEECWRNLSKICMLLILKKEVHGFPERLNVISRFISPLTVTCEPIFELPCKDQVIIWNENCQGAFDKKVRPREFQESGLVLKRTLLIHKDPRGTWTPNYEDP